MANKRESWGGNFGFLMAAVGSAVGLGNIWAFPFKMGANGGFAFLVLYLLLAAPMAYIVMVSELTLGRMARRGCIGTYNKLSSSPWFKWIGWLGVLSAFLITGFYTVLGAYCIKYFAVNVGDIFGASWGSNGLNGGKIFGNILTNQAESIVYSVIFMAMTAGVIAFGVKSGIEKFSKIVMPVLFALLLIVIFRSVTLPGAEKGLAYMFEPNLTPFKENFLGVFSAAICQLFFSLSMGMAIMVTYGSYMTHDQNLCKNSIFIIFADTLIAVLAGVAVIPAAFALGGEGAALAGPKLLYITLQNVFQSMGAVGPYVGTIFYALVVIAAITSSVSLTETVVTYFMDRDADKGKEGSRKTYSLIATLSIGVVAVLVAADGLGSNGVWVPLQSTFGVQPWNDCWLDLLDAVSEGFMMPLGAFLMCIFIGYELKISTLKAEIEKTGHKFLGEAFFTVCCKYVAPLMLLFVLYNQVKSFNLI